LPLVFPGLRAPGPDETVADCAAYYRHLISATDGLAAVLVLVAGVADYRKIVERR